MDFHNMVAMPFIWAVLCLTLLSLIVHGTGGPPDQRW